ncbi:hypothetical protein BKP35_00665 [Anaerobacillus arseniciselenatis]|uniref:Uncharacterized protein n=1 Tax=Anaerobacillus arseniciselenatis TaxID=85682 RepID=A0A1S2LSN5_9BACI|nr:hypothetical protein [Anaerobacillus arseniciselenatis]OIJ15539.1 hypothetical protein BKP35_00665 [Anaerobacillus arseniciselenatis]
MKKVALVGEAIFGFIITYLSVLAALAVLPTFLGVVINIYSGNHQNIGTLITFLVCASVLSSSMIIKHFKSINIIPAK